MAHVPKQEDWRELARRILQESDPQKTIKLVQQLVTKFDEEKPKPSPRSE